MATMASSPASHSLPSSPTMSSSHSSEGSIGFVMVDKSSYDEHSKIPQSNDDGSPEIPSKSDSLEAGSTLAQDHELVERVQILTKENEELKGVLLQNNKLLEEYFQDLANMQKNQKQTNESLRKGYDHAKDVVKKLREKNACLKTELKNEQDKNLQLEEQMAKLKDEKANHPSSQSDTKTQDADNHSSPSKVHSNPSQVQSLTEVIKRLESEKVTLEINNSKLQEHISCLRAMREADEPDIETDECETLVSLGSLPSDQLSVEAMQEKYTKLETEKEILKVDLEKLKITSEQKQQEFHQMEEDHNNLLKKLADMEQKQAELMGAQASAEPGQITELSQQLEVQTEVLAKLKEELDTVRQEREAYQRRVEELEQAKEEIVKTEQAMSQTEPTMDTADQHFETENRDATLKEQLVKLTQERDVYKKKLEEFETHLEEAKASAEDAFGEVEDTEMKEKYGKLKHQLLVYQRHEEEILSKENALFLEREEAQKQETVKKEEIERLKQLLSNYQEKEREELEAANNLRASQAELAKETTKLKQQFEAERIEFVKKLDNLTQERDMYKMKAEEYETQPAEDSKTNAEEVLGEVADADLKAKFVKVRNQLWNYQKRENDILNRENAVLEKEEANKQLLKEKESLQHQLAEALMKGEELLQEKQKQDEESQSVKRQLSESHEHEVFLLREELQTKSTAMATAQTSEEQLKAQVAHLIQENQNLVIECEKHKADCAKQEQEAKSVQRQLSDSHEHEVLVLKEELQTKDTAMATVQTSEQHLKAQVTQLIQENQALSDELERLKEDLQQQENMYQDHLHKVTQDSEHQRQKRDEIIKAVKMQLSNTEAELQNTRAQHIANNKVCQQLQQEHDKVVADYQELLESYHTTLDTNKEQERNAQMQMSGLQSDVGKLRADLTEADQHVEKLKEDIHLRENELSALREQTFNLQKLDEQFPILQAQLELYRGDFQMEREAREKQHEEILRLREQVCQLQQENQHYQDEMDRLGNTQMAEMQRRHGSYIPESQPQSQQPRGWFDGFSVIPNLFSQGSETPRNPEVHMQAGGQIPGRGQREQQEQRTGPVVEEDWVCPTCRRTFPDFDNLQVHAVECNASQQGAPIHQCPKCMEIFPDYDSLDIHVTECLEQE